jgi:antitoxin HigA-1
MTLERRGPAGWAIHPGEILKEEFMAPLELSSYAVAKALHVPVQGVHDIVLRKRGITPAMALRFARLFGTTEEFWLNLQASYELAHEQKRLKKSLNSIRPIRRSSVA